jgi:hypothetical protein
VRKSAGAFAPFAGENNKKHERTEKSKKLRVKPLLSRQHKFGRYLIRLACRLNKKYAHDGKIMIKSGKNMDFEVE